MCKVHQMYNLFLYVTKLSISNKFFILLIERGKFIHVFYLEESDAKILNNMKKNKGFSMAKKG